MASFVSFSIWPVALILAMLITVNQAICDLDPGPQCPDASGNLNALIATGGTALVAWVVSVLGGGRIKRGRSALGSVLVVVAAGAMAILVAWLRTDLGIPFPY